ncbi:MAG: hypothetical protein HZA36_00900 [Parcubacteria group bacterium]|nr:hypothetical protein [Parcubacteria group bacterium]
MTVFSYDKVEKKYLWASLVPCVATDDVWQRLYWPVLFSLCVIIGMLLFSHIFFSIAQTDFVFDIKKAEHDSKLLEGQNNELKMRLGMITSPLRLIEVAKERGLIKIQNPLHVSLL